MFRLKRVLGYTAVSLSDCAFDLVHMHRGKLVFECLLCALEVLVQGGMDVSADRAEREGVLVEMEERVCLGLVDRKRERDVFEQTREAYAALAFAAAAMACLSVVAAFSYGGKRFEEHFADFCECFGIEDMYSGGFYPFLDKETSWAWWSRMIWMNRYACPVGKAYEDLAAVLRGRDCFVLTTNVDHQFQRAGIDKARLFYMQGDYGLFQCSRS